MKDELPESSKTSANVDENKADEAVGKEPSPEQAEGKSDVKPAAVSRETGAPPSESNVSTAAAAALASAAVKAKVYLSTRLVSCCGNLFTCSTLPMLRSVKSNPWWLCWWRHR